MTLTKDNKPRDAVVQLTKMGFTFVLDRDTGQPLFPVQEVSVPRSTVRGEETAPMQVIPLKPPPLVRQAVTEADLTNITPEARAYALKEFRKYVSGPIFTPRACRARSRRRDTWEAPNGTAAASIRP